MKTKETCTTKTSYQLLHKDTHEPLHYYTEDQSGQYACNPVGYFFIENSNYFYKYIWEVDTWLEAAYVLVKDTPYYNTTQSTPGHREVNIDNYYIGKVSTETKKNITKIDKKLPLSFSSYFQDVHDRDKYTVYAKLIEGSQVEVGDLVFRGIGSISEVLSFEITNIYGKEEEWVVLSRAF